MKGKDKKKKSKRPESAVDNREEELVGGADRQHGRGGVYASQIPQSSGNFA